MKSGYFAANVRRARDTREYLDRLDRSLAFVLSFPFRLYSYVHITASTAAASLRLEIAWQREYANRSYEYSTR